MALKSREKVFLSFALIAIAILIFDQVYYTPQSRKISRLKGEIKAAESRSKESLLLTKGIKTEEAGLSRLEKELQGLKRRTPSRDRFEGFLKHLAGESNRLQLKMVSLVTHGEVTASPSSPEEKKKPSSPQLEKVNLELHLHADFNSLGRYLKAIEELPLLAVVNNLQVERDEKLFPLLKVTLGLTVYLTPS